MLDLRNEMMKLNENVLNNLDNAM